MTLETMAQLDFCHLMFFCCCVIHSIQTHLKIFSLQLPLERMVLRPRAKLLSRAEGWKTADPGEKLLFSGAAVLWQG